MAETDDSAAVNLMLLDELRLFEIRATVLCETGAEVQQKRALEDGAKLQYSSMKEHLAARLKEFERRRPAGVSDWVAASFINALREGRNEMRAPTDASPLTEAWRAAAQGVRAEMSYQVDKMQKGLKR